MYNFEDEEFVSAYNSYMKAKRARERAVLKELKNNAQKIKNQMSVEDKINLMNTPYEKLPEELKPGMVKRPQRFNFVRISKPNIGKQKETFAARLIRYMTKYDLNEDQFSRICNEFARKYDIKAKDGKAQITRITSTDVRNYINYNICPKIDKMTVIAKAMGVNIDYFAGYGAVNRRSNNQVLESRYRKRRNSVSVSLT